MKCRDAEKKGVPLREPLEKGDSYIPFPVSHDR